MGVSNNTGLLIAFVAVVVLFLFFGFSAMSGSFMGGWTRGGGMMGGGFGGNGWMWFPTLITLAAGVFLGWMLFGHKK